MWKVDVLCLLDTCILTAAISVPLGPRYRLPGVLRIFSTSSAFSMHVRKCCWYKSNFAMRFCTLFPPGRYRMISQKWCISENISWVAKYQHYEITVSEYWARYTLNCLIVSNFNNLDLIINDKLTITVINRVERWMIHLKQTRLISRFGWFVQLR